MLNAKFFTILNENALKLLIVGQLCHMAFVEEKRSL